MLTSEVERSLVEQIGKEGFSSNLYLAMASWAESEGYPGISAWFYAQSEEEHGHMLKIVHYVIDRGGKAIIPAFEKPPVAWEGVHDVFVRVLLHEQSVSRSINDILGVCFREGDYATSQWLQWFVSEQIEEESSVRAILDRLKLLGDGSLYDFDKDILAMRSAGVE
ncbi:MAG: ferritin [Dysgonamonadaceae bacterium]|jgi:ferritin|nr:ferritin [Dysgonamonadaceae bacterium]